MEDYRDSVLRKFAIKENEKEQVEVFTHSYYQGLITEIGNMKHFQTFTPVQDKNRMFLDKKLGDISTMKEMPEFTYEKIVKRARTIDTVWFNERNLPNAFYEVEHSTNIINSLNKFFELQDFRANFFIVADTKRKKEFDDKISQSIYNPIKPLVKFVDYESLSNQYTLMSKMVRESSILL